MISVTSAVVPGLDLEALHDHFWSAFVLEALALILFIGHSLSD